jgi:hypothetical protein
MKVRCINNGVIIFSAAENLTLGKIYLVENIDNEETFYYKIKDDTGNTRWYSQNRFVIVEEEKMEVIKIKEWQDLNNKSNDDYYLEVIGTRIFVYRITTSILEISIFFEQMPKQKVIELLLHLGFNVKFKELPKISDRLYQICKAYKGWWLAVDESGGVTISQRKPNRALGQWKTSSRVNCMTALDTGMTFEDEPIDTNDIIRMYEQLINTNI